MLLFFLRGVCLDTIIILELKVDYNVAKNNVICFGVKQISCKTT